MSYGLLIDLSFCGSDCFDQLNNPICSTFTILDEKLDVKKSIINYVVPEEKITFSAYSLHRISLEDINEHEDKLDLDTYLKTAYAMLTKCRDKGLYLIGFNHISFDLGILNKHFTERLGLNPITWPEDKIIDIVSLCTKSIDFKTIGNYTLDSCLAYYMKDSDKIQIEQLDKHHSAINDSESEILIMREFMERNNMSTFDEIIEFQKTMVEFKYFSWGKYKGLEVEKVFNLDRQYLNWCLKNSDVNKRHPNLIKKIKEFYMKV